MSIGFAYVWFYKGGGQGLHADAHVFTASSALDAKSFRFVSCYWAVFTAHLLLMGLKWK